MRNYKNIKPSLDVQLNVYSFFKKVVGNMQNQHDVIIENSEIDWK